MNDERDSALRFDLIIRGDTLQPLSLPDVVLFLFGLNRLYEVAVVSFDTRINGEEVLSQWQRGESPLDSDEQLVLVSVAQNSPCEFIVRIRKATGRTLVAAGFVVGVVSGVLQIVESPLAQGMARDAFEAMQDMQERGEWPDGLRSVPENQDEFNACARAVEEGPYSQQYRAAMQRLRRGSRRWRGSRVALRRTEA